MRISQMIRRTACVTLIYDYPPILRLLFKEERTPSKILPITTQNLGNYGIPTYFILTAKLF